MNVSTVVRDGPVGLSVVIPTHNRPAALRETLQRLARQSFNQRWEVVVVNNRCTDDTDQVVLDLAPTFPARLRVVHEQRPGASAARNHGSRAAEGSLLVLLDDDILLGEGQLARAVADHLSRPLAWFVAQILPLPAHLSTPFGAFRRAVFPATPRFEPIREVEWFASGFSVMARAALLQLGGYNEDYPTAALEDADLFIRARRSGIRFAYDPELVGVHNDWAGASLQDFCQRQRIHCRTAPLLQEKFGGESHPWSELIKVNSPPRSGGDSPRVVIKKVAKGWGSRPAPMAALIEAAVLLERCRGPRRLLWRLYRAAIGASMYGGYQEGLALIRADQERFRNAGPEGVPQ